MATRSLRHQAALTVLTAALETHVRRAALGAVFVGPVEVALSQDVRVRPDLVFIASRHRGRITDAHIQGAPDLIIEIVTSAAASRAPEKRRARYESFGVEEVWLIDPDAESVDVLRREGTRLDVADVLTAGYDEVLETPQLPGLEIALTALFAG